MATESTSDTPACVGSSSSPEGYPNEAAPDCLAVTAFRRGDLWAWWVLLFGNTIALVSAMRYDWIVNAIGPFELTEYLGLAAVWGALALTAPFLKFAFRPETG